jgi:serine/threonine-protein kinase
MLVFEYLERGTLAERLRHVGPLEVADALALTIAIAGALRSVHDAGLVHGDVKPSNIGFNGAGVPKLLDFGVASLISSSRAAADVSLTDDATHTASDDGFLSAMGSSLVGTPAYLPPEAFDNPRPAPGFDLWAVTLVLYEALTGRNPFQGPSPIGTVLLVRESDIPPVTKYRPDCPAPLALLLARGLQPRSEHRYSSASALETALSACADAVGIRCN